MNEQLLLTPEALVGLLTQIVELDQYSVALEVMQDGSYKLAIGDSVYIISSKDATDVPVDDTALDLVSEASADALDDLMESGFEDTDMDNIESGMFKELVKTLLVGGLVRLTGKALRY